MKNVIIIITIIGLVIFGNVVSQNILKSDSEEITIILEDIKTKLGNNNENNKEMDKSEYKEALDKSNELNEKWEEIENIWAVIVTHNELDMIKTAILGVKSGLECNDILFAYEQIDNSIFLINHIKEKQKTCLKNMF